jgi:hypothetical protein
MTQRERDRLVVLKKAQKKRIKQRQAAEELGVTVRQLRRMLSGLRRGTAAGRNRHQNLRNPAHAAF